MVRVAAYVDGFNLYFGLKDRYARRYLWLDLQALSESLLRKGQHWPTSPISLPVFAVTSKVSSASPIISMPSPATVRSCP